jgi:hypothetical protein
LNLRAKVGGLDEREAARRLQHIGTDEISRPTNKPPEAAQSGITGWMC